jgi:hypothetical protein
MIDLYTSLVSIAFGLGTSLTISVGFLTMVETKVEQCRRERLYEAMVKYAIKGRQDVFSTILQEVWELRLPLTPFMTYIDWCRTQSLRYPWYVEQLVSIYLHGLKRVVIQGETPENLRYYR